MKKSLSVLFITLASAFGLVFALVLGSSAAFSQATPEGSGSIIHPAHIHAGMCPKPGDVVFPLANVVPSIGDANTGTPGAAAAAVSSPDAHPVEVGTPAAAIGMEFESSTVVEAPLDDILGAEHAINVHLSPDQMSVYVACGDISGEAQDGELVVQMEALNDSGLSGEATLTDNGDGTTTVEIHLSQMDGGAQATPEATPGS